MADFLHMRAEDMSVSHHAHGDYEYTKRIFIPRGMGNTLVCVYEVPPGKSVYPYHYHLRNEEIFHILAGEGCLRTPQGERQVTAGDYLYFPAGPEGAHKLTNTGSVPLVYIDFDGVHELDVCRYPDSGKMAVWGMGVNRVYPEDANVDYYEGE